MKMTNKQIEVIKKVENLLEINLLDVCSFVKRNVILLDAGSISSVDAVNVERMGNQYKLFKTELCMNGKRMYLHCE